MGHSTLSMTERYSKLSPDTKRTAVAEISLPPSQESAPSAGEPCTPQDQTVHNGQFVQS